MPPQNDIRTLSSYKKYEYWVLVAVHGNTNSPTAIKSVKRSDPNSIIALNQRYAWFSLSGKSKTHIRTNFILVTLWTANTYRKIGFDTNFFCFGEIYFFAKSFFVSTKKFHSMYWSQSQTPASFPTYSVLNPPMLLSNNYKPYLFSLLMRNPRCWRGRRTLMQSRSQNMKS